MKALFKMTFDCGIEDCLEGVFVADTEDVKYLIENKISIHFGEVLGKHSDVSGPVGKDEIKLITSDENVISIVEKYGLESGYNPFNENLCVWETEGVPEIKNVEFDDFTIKEYIDYKRDGIIPDYYLDEHE